LRYGRFGVVLWKSLRQHKRSKLWGEVLIPVQPFVPQCCAGQQGSQIVRLARATLQTGRCTGVWTGQRQIGIDRQMQLPTSVEGHHQNVIQGKLCRSNPPAPIALIGTWRSSPSGTLSTECVRGSAVSIGWWARNLAHLRSNV